jgi:hypothetical protein
MFCKRTARSADHTGDNLNRKEIRMSADVAEGFLGAIEHGRIQTCDAFSPGARIDATVPNWRYSLEGADAVKAELSRWYADPGTFEELTRTSVTGGELVMFTLCWEEQRTPHAVHQAHVIMVNSEGIASDTIWCGGRWPASLLAEMEEASRGQS